MTNELARAPVRIRWGEQIPMRDGIRLSATLYLPKQMTAPAPAIVTMTPYIAQTYHDRGLYFAERGWPFLTVDVRGRGNSEGEFRPNIQEARDGHDVVEWLAQQPFCNGKVAMWGGSYAGYAQWATAKEFPPHLAAIAPVAAPFIGVDFPIRNNVPAPYAMQWLTLVAGRASQDRIFGCDVTFWGGRFREWLEADVAFAQLDTFLGMPSPIFQEWVAHPHRDAYWDSYNPAAEQYARISIPILTITGIYDGDQLGALAHYRNHFANASDAARKHHYLIIGPWDHAGTRVPATQFAGLTVGPASLLDLAKLHVEWYAWSLQGAARPEFLQRNVAYYVMGADRWRYADSLEGITSRIDSYYIHSEVRPDGVGNPSDVFHSGALRSRPSGNTAPDCYIYDPRDVTHAAIESLVDPDNVVDQRMIHALRGKLLAYHTEPFGQDTEVSGFFELSLWLSIDQPDTDVRAFIYEVDASGATVLLTEDWLRVRYSDSPYEEKLLSGTAPALYRFAQFPFVSRMVKRGARLRLVIRPLHSIYFQKNHNSGGVVAAETMSVARTVTVKLFHDEQHLSQLRIPIGQPEEARDE